MLQPNPDSLFLSVIIVPKTKFKNKLNNENSNILLRFFIFLNSHPQATRQNQERKTGATFSLLVLNGLELQLQVASSIHPGEAVLAGAGPGRFGWRSHRGGDRTEGEANVHG